MNHLGERRHLTLTWSLLITLLLSISACENMGEEDEETEEETAAIPVETITPTRNDIDATYSGTAPIEAFSDATVIAKVGGEIVSILAEEGDDVSAGQILAELDGDRLALESQQAEANLRKLQRDYQRNLDLKDKGLISTGDFEKIQYEMEALQATYDLTELEYSYTKIRAPIDGVVSRRSIKIGNTIDINTEAFQVTSLEPLVSYLHIPEREFRRIQAGQLAKIVIDALQGTSFDATVARVSPIIDPETGTFKITIEVSDQTRSLKPGMFGRINIVYDRRENVLQIPRSAVIEESGQSIVFVVDNGIAEKRTIITGFSEGGNVEILDGLSDNDEVVFVGHINLKNGAKVSVINVNKSSQTVESATRLSSDNAVDGLK